MAIPRLTSLSRRLTTTFLRRTFSSSAATTTTPRFSPLRLISAVNLPNTAFEPPCSSRGFATQQSQHSMNDYSSHRLPKEMDLLDGCDFEHWLIVIDPPPQDWSRDQIINDYIKILAQIVGSEEEARMKIYNVSTKYYFAFGAFISEELSAKFKELEMVRWVIPDSYLDVKNKDYGGEPFINGEAVPYDPKYHEVWVRNCEKARSRNSYNGRPRNSDY